VADPGAPGHHGVRRRRHRQPLLGRRDRLGRDRRGRAGRAGPAQAQIRAVQADRGSRRPGASARGRGPVACQGGRRGRRQRREGEQPGRLAVTCAARSRGPGATAWPGCGRSRAR
jgi:hypothetical protein